MTLTRFGYTASSIWDAPVFPDTCNPSQAVGSGEQEEHCLPRVFGRRELNKEQEKGKWLLWCLHLPLFSPPPKKKKLKFDFPEAAPKEITWHSKEKAYLFFFSHLQTWLQKQPLCKRKKTLYCLLEPTAAKQMDPRGPGLRVGVRRGRNNVTRYLVSGLPELGVMHDWKGQIS